MVVMEDPVRYHARIVDFPENQRPRERLREVGAKYLNDAELMAILLRTGIKGQNVVALSQQLLAQGRRITRPVRRGLRQALRAQGHKRCQSLPTTGRR